MKAFLKRLLQIALIPIGIMVIYNGLGLALITTYYPYPEQGLANYLRNDTTQRGSKLLIGCSNLKHNINPDTLWQTHPEVDFLYFPAVVNSTFMHYITSLSPFNTYDTILFYAPYSFYQKSVAVREGEKIDRSYTCGSYALQTIRQNPINFFNNWLYRFWNIKQKRVYASNSPAFYLPIDTYMINLRKDTNFSQGRLRFQHDKHIIDPVIFNDKDIDAFQAVFPGKQVYLVFPPIPNIPENEAFIEECATSSQGFPSVLQRPRTEDSSLFFDQWFHMNGIGNARETKAMSKHLDTLARCR
ncbi:MAG: hypothetical protein ACR2IL_04945 [Chitinophagaceae bacterium]